MSGIVFFRTAERDAVVEFYRQRLDFETWLEQDGCTILRHDDLKLGFCDADGESDTDTGSETTDQAATVGEPDTEGIVTLYYDAREAVDETRERLADVATDDPRVNEQYDVYQFFAEDPEGRTLEFQTFLHDLPE